MTYRALGADGMMNIIIQLGHRAAWAHTEAMVLLRETLGGEIRVSQ